MNVQECMYVCTRLCAKERKKNSITHFSYKCFKILQMPTGHPLAQVFSNPSIFVSYAIHK